MIDALEPNLEGVGGAPLTKVGGVAVGGPLGADRGPQTTVGVRRWRRGLLLATSLTLKKDDNLDPEGVLDELDRRSTCQRLSRPTLEGLGTWDWNGAVTVSSTGAKNLIQGDDNGHVGRPGEVSPAPPCPELVSYPFSP